MSSAADQQADRRDGDQCHYRNLVGSSRPKTPGQEKPGGTDLLAQEAHRPWQDLLANEVLFCPISGWDLQLVGDLASVFVLVDWRFGPEVFEKSIWPDIVAGKYTGLRPADQNPVIAVPDEEVRALSGRRTALADLGR